LPFGCALYFAGLCPHIYTKSSLNRLLFGVEIGSDKQTASKLRLRADCLPCRFKHIYKFIASSGSAEPQKFAKVQSAPLSFITLR